MTAQDHHTVWTQFILAAALARTARAGVQAAGDGDEASSFCYADTHAGPGWQDARPMGLDAVMAERAAFANPAFFPAAEPLPDGRHPGSWTVAARVLNGLDLPGLAVEIDINDVDVDVITAARATRGGNWVRYWTHDWFRFLRSRLTVGRPPDFVLVDPPPDDPRGPAYGIDAAILLDTLAVPYMLTYPLEAPQDSIDQIGRTGLELRFADRGHGALLGGGAEGAMLDLLPDLRRLAGILGGTFAARLPRCDDYSI